MDKRFVILDERNVWWRPAMDAAERRGYQTQHIRRGHEAVGPGLGFIRPHADPKVLEQNHADYEYMAERLTMVQDRRHVELYEDKSGQFWAFGQWMPPTWRFENREKALEFVAGYDGWLVSKADVGASSYNVRILKTRDEQVAHVRALFGRGILVNHCSGGPGGSNSTSTQRGYVLFQKYIPHDVTWRVNVIGRAHAIFKRFNAPGTLVAQTGNVDGLRRMDGPALGAAAKALEIAHAIGTKWCAFDLLRDEDGTFKLLETSLAWPWPSPTNCMEAQFFGPTKRVWAEIWDLLLDEYEAGVWS